MEFLTEMILEKMGEGGPEVIAQMFAASIFMNVILLLFCLTLAAVKRDK